jgi:hypothetical protein
MLTFCAGRPQDFLGLAGFKWEGFNMATRKEKYGKSTVKKIFSSMGTDILELSMPANSTTGRHSEKRSYIVMPLTGGELHRNVYRRSAKGESIKSDDWSLDPFECYRRNIKTSIDMELFNDGPKEIKVLKIYDGTK